jgi:hypothetical protein
MENISKFNIVKAIKTKHNEIIPIWDNIIEFHKTELYGNVIKIKGGNDTYNLIEVIYNLETREISAGVELDIYPNITEFAKDEIVLSEVQHSSYRIDKIIDIIFEEFEMVIQKGKKIDNNYLKDLKDIVIEPKTIYCIKVWKPTYVLESGLKTTWSHKLKKLVK